MNAFVQDRKKTLISMICLDADEGYLQEYLSSQENINIEYVQVTGEDSYEDIIQYMNHTASRYICFFEAGYVYDKDRICRMAEYMDSHPDVQIAISPRRHIDENGVIISTSGMFDCTYLGQAVLQYSLQETSNIYGSLSTVMVSAEYARRIPWDIPHSGSDAINRVALLYQLLLYGNVGFLKTSLVSVKLKVRNADTERGIIEAEQAYRDYVHDLYVQRLIDICWEPPERKEPVVKKEITFFYTDKGEYYNLKPIADKAASRGYRVDFTDNLVKEAEIGVYCQHSNMIEPVNAKFSLILLHDMAQGHNRWPDIWKGENWDKFDIGIVPGKTWADRWSRCACWGYANPRCGVFAFGYPKSDLIEDMELKERARKLREKFRLKYDFSVLYAPSWENNEKEDDFVRALASLNVNLLIKQAHWNQAYAHIIENIKVMRKQHEGKYDNIYYIEPEESIMTALELCDMVVSDESSVMAEAAMYGKPSLAVTDWLIPDTNPPRPASCPMEYILKCRKVEIREYVEKLCSHTFPESQIEDILQKGQNEFTNKGKCCDDILDAIAYYTGGEPAGNGFLSKKVESLYNACTLWN